MAEQLIDSMSGPWNPRDYRDTYTERVKDLVSAKRKGEEVVTESEAPEATNVTDLLEVLRRSVDEAGSRRRGSSKTGTRTTSRRTAKKTATKKAAKPAGKKTAKGTPAKKSSAARKSATRKSA